MPLHPEFPVFERILVFGPAGSGKTTSWLKIAELASKTKSDAVFYVGDTDAAVTRMLLGYNISNLELHSLYDWPEYVEFGKRVITTARPQDWIILDFIGSAWNAVQQHFVSEIFKQDIGDYFLQARKELGSGAKNLSALEGWVDWPVINAMYRQWITPLLYRTRSNILATAQGEPLSDSRNPTEDQATRALLLPFGAKPVGQKALPHQFHTLLLSARDARGGWTFNTVKDRERVEVRGQAVSNFALDYLVKIGGWKIA